MTSYLWQPADAERLKCLREQADLSANEFAKANAISLAQLDQLENEGVSAFYSPLIKYQLGKRLLNIWGEKTAAEISSLALHETFSEPQQLVNPKVELKKQTLAALEKIADISNRDYNPSACKAGFQAIRVCWKEHIVFSRCVLIAISLLIVNYFFKGPLIAWRDKYFSRNAHVIVEVIANNTDTNANNPAVPLPIQKTRDAEISSRAVSFPNDPFLLVPTPFKAAESQAVNGQTLFRLN
jgi:DNA-binding XRE family transcriptional regulator